MRIANGSHDLCVPIIEATLCIETVKKKKTTQRWIYPSNDWTIILSCFIYTSGMAESRFWAIWLNEILLKLFKLGKWKSIGAVQTISI